MVDPAVTSAETDRVWLERAIELSRRCTASPLAYSVGAVIVADGRILAEGWSRQSGLATHAEEIALAVLARAGPGGPAPNDGSAPGGPASGGGAGAPGGPAPGDGAVRGAGAPGGPGPEPGSALLGATLYSSLEPCSQRASRPRSCTQLILDAGIGRVVFALREPPLFVRCEGAELLAAAGVEVVEVTDLAGSVVAVNAHLLGR